MSWPVKPLGEVADTALGKMLDKGRDSGKPRVQYLRNVNVQWGRIDADDLLSMELADAELERFEVLEGDLLVCEGGEIGRCAIWRGRPEYIAFQKALHRIRPSAVLNVRFLRYLLEHQANNGTLAAFATGSTIAHLPQQQLRRIPVPLPPSDEQHRIVEILEDHLSRLNSANAALDRCARRVSAMKDVFLARCVRELSSVNGTQVVPLGQISQVLTGATPLRSNSDFYLNGTIPWITSGDLHQGRVTKPSQFVTEAALARTNIKLVPAGSLLIAMYGEGRTRGTVAELGIDATTNQACAAVVLDDPELRAWVRLVLDANYTAMRRMAAGGVQPNLNLSLVRSIEVPIPPESIRATLLGKLDELNASRERLSAELSAAKMRSNRLRGAILSAAFSGRLTGSSAELRKVESV
ncbi:restriction endonuclease subunit S [Mycobacterium sp. SMC-16]|uniref:restriction endonuclease subunit S n=1 Tax=Mycobacterium sp. SMC-16 TaxID=3385967 RepID=UPI00390C544C